MGDIMAPAFEDVMWTGYPDWLANNPTARVETISFPPSRVTSKLIEGPTAGKLQAAFASNDPKGAAALFSSDAVYEDMTLPKRSVRALDPRNRRRRTGTFFTRRNARHGLLAQHQPDKEIGAGNWRDDQLARTIREGISHDGSAVGMPLSVGPSA